MANFIIEFIIRNIFISAIMGFFFVTKYLLKNHLSSRMQYNLWFPMLSLLIVPFLPIHTIGFPQFFSWLSELSNSSLSNTEAILNQTATHEIRNVPNWMNDFTLSVSQKTT